MKQRNILTLILLLVALTLAAQSNYSPCYTNNMSKGDALYKQGKYTEARSYYFNAKQCAGGNPTEAQKKIAACDAKIKAQREAEEVKRKAEAEAAEAKRKAEAEATEENRLLQLKEKSSYSNGILTIDGVKYKMIYVQGGTFTMGCTSEQGSECDDDEKPAHSVTLSDFYMGETEVTQALWLAVMGTEPSYDGGWEDKYGRGSDYPAYRINWNDCQEFIRKLNQLTGKTFRLPTESEWEYAARGGNKNQHYKFAGSITIDDVAWYVKNSGGMTHQVKTKSSNALGLYDMSGNVWEWCWDWYSSNYYSESPSKNPQGPSTGSNRVIRGGGWGYYARRCRVSDRYDGTPDDCFNSIGFRLELLP